MCMDKQTEAVQMLSKPVLLGEGGANEENWVALYILKRHSIRTQFQSPNLSVQFKVITLLFCLEICIWVEILEYIPVRFPTFLFSCVYRSLTNICKQQAEKSVKNW